MSKHYKTNPNIKHKYKILISAKYGRIQCPCCDKTFAKNDFISITIDHINPNDLDRNDPMNYQPMCKKCNGYKGNIFFDFEKYKITQDEAKLIRNLGSDVLKQVCHVLYKK